ncbi:MAG: pyruvate carboxylase subunit B, partial [Desulfotomaculales bacterium]
MSSETAQKPIKITDTTLRDGHQSLLATRMRLEHMLPILEKIDRVGYHSLEVWGGATFDTCLRFLDEDPWERLRTIKKHCKTPLQMLLRGQNIVGYKNYPDDVLTEFIKKTVSNGLDIFRIFDALNDVRNMQKAMEVAKQEGAHVQAVACYTISPVHDVEYYVNLARELEEMGADSICLKDMAGILAPGPAYQIIKAWKETVKVPVQLHCHYTSGMASMCYLRAIEAGVDIIDCSISSLALQTSQPAVEAMVGALQGTPYDPGFDLKLLSEIADYFAEVRRKYYSEYDLSPKSVDVNVLIYQIPGGMMSNFISQLKEQGALDRLPEVLEELPRTRADLGYPPLVTPTSQIVGIQAVFNVLFGRWVINTNETINYVRGFYGRPPGPINKEAKRMIIGDEEPITKRPADLLPPGLEEARKLAEPYLEKEEDVISVA